MSSKRFIAPLAMAVTGVLALAPSALANHPDDSYGAASCVLAGVAGTAAIIAGEDGVNGIPHDLFPPSGNPNATPDLDNDTDPGHFQFNGTAVCSGADTAWEGGTPLTGPPPNKIPVIPPTVFTLQAGGDYDNVLTGTGTANGDAKISHPTIPAGTFDSGTTVFTEFSIDFAGGVGHLDFVVDADESAPFTCVNGQIATAPSQDQLPYVPLGYYGAPGTHSHVGDNQVDGGDGFGAIDIAPTTTDGTMQEDVLAFTVTGSFSGILSGEGSSNDDNGAGCFIPSDDSDN